LRSGSARGRLTVTAAPSIASYGYGLALDHDPVRGDIANHSGGYAGFGSNMRWHLDSGIGVIALANGRDPGVSAAARTALEVLLDAAGAPARTVVLWPETRAAAGAVDAALSAGSDPFAAGLDFAANVEPDRDWEARRAELAGLLAEIGALDPDAAPVWTASEAANHLVWTRAGRRGRLRAELRLTPHARPQIDVLAFARDDALPPTDIIATHPRQRLL
jgi:hypothetical protein